MNQDCADFLAYIVGTTPKAPEPPERPPESLNLVALWPSPAAGSTESGR